MKAYVNDYGAAITSEILLRNLLSIEYVRSYKTETYDENLKLYIKEGLNWMHKNMDLKVNGLCKCLLKPFMTNFSKITKN